VRGGVTLTMDEERYIGIGDGWGTERERAIRSHSDAQQYCNRNVSTCLHVYLIVKR